MITVERIQASAPGVDAIKAAAILERIQQMKAGTLLETLAKPRQGHGGVVTRVMPAMVMPTERKPCCQRGGPGSEMKSLLRELDVPSGWCESCSQRAALMDSNGVEWCPKNRSTIVGWLQEVERNFATAAARVERNDGQEPTEQQIRKARDAQRWRTGWAAAARFVWINPLDPFGSLIDTAIQRAESAAKCENGSCGT